MELTSFKQVLGRLLHVDLPLQENSQNDSPSKSSSIFHLRNAQVPQNVVCSAFERQPLQNTKENSRSCGGLCFMEGYGKE